MLLLPGTSSHWASRFCLFFKQKENKQIGHWENWFVSSGFFWPWRPHKTERSHRGHILCSNCVNMSSSKETEDKWLTMAPLSIPKSNLASSLSQHCKCLLQSLWLIPWLSVLLTSTLTLNYSGSLAPLPTASHSYTMPFHFIHVPSFCSLGSFFLSF